MKPIRPVSQKRQPRAHPTCEDTHTLQRGFSRDRVFLNLERRMECGIGKCGHCAVGYTFTCLHGPVFSLWDAINLPELIHE